MHEERVLLDDGLLLELRLRAPDDYRLACLRDGRTLVELSSDGGHAFQSVEKLRYDFERALENALRQG
jgi:hypothetical protein